MSCRNLETLRLAQMIAGVALAATSASVRAEVTRIEIHKSSAYAGGRSFENVGPYRHLKGTAHFRVDPESQANAAIVDLSLAPRNEAGFVEFSADVEILTPEDPAKARGTLLYGVNNRGRKLALNWFGEGADHFLMRHGFIVVWSGWIAEMPRGEVKGTGRPLRLDAPVARGKSGPITGLCRFEIVTDEPAARMNIANRPGFGSYAPTERGRREATLTWRLREGDRRVPIPREQFRLEVKRLPGKGEQYRPPIVELVLAGGFQPGYIYELIFEAQDPVVQGLGFAGIRDLVSFLRRDTSAANPLVNQQKQPVVERAIGFGVSQSARCLRMLTYQGFNADEQGRPVFDGLMPVVSGGGVGFFNHRFAMPTRYASQHVNHLYPCDYFPFAYETQQDPLSTRTGGILRRAREQNAVPKVMHVQTSAEYWHRSGSLVHTDTQGMRDAKLPAEVRLYAVGGAQHSTGDDLHPARGSGTLPENPTDYRPLLRGLLVALEAWIRGGTTPPPSRYPRIADGTLVPWQQAQSDWDALPGIRYPQLIQQPRLLDYGPRFHSDGILSKHPPAAGPAYTVLVPAHAEDNNERGMLQLPSIAVPVATYTGWNLRHRRIGAEQELLRLKGASLPFAATRKQREAVGDRRPSLAERYGSFAAYREQYEQAARRLVRERYLLEEDLDLILSRADARRSLFEESQSE